ncbi:hypothetical protein EZS27_021813 [termite gut metagenome]|uniref:DUF3127 domain-containing protein n=1 Tax=termite gut metagenome TaxID=433724 RepID=A0A5J4R6Y1_9ZZZZ
MDFSGKIIAVLPQRSGVGKATGTEWQVQEYVIESHDQYPKKMCFSVFGTDKIAQYNIQLNEELTVSFDIDARQWQDRWFNSIRAWKVERLAAGETPSVATTTNTSTPPPPPTAIPEFTQGDANDDLPF